MGLETSSGVFRFSEKDKSIIKGKVRRRNIEFVLLMAVVGFPIAIMVAGVYYHGLDSLDGVEYTWRKTVLSLLLSLAFIFAASGVFAYCLKVRSASGRGETP